MIATLQVQVTDICNLKCPYCYVKQRKNVLTFDMFLRQYEKLDKLFSLFAYYKPEHRKFNVGFFGGEPLLNLDVILKITEFLRKENRLADAHIQTNGTILTKDIVDILNTNGIGWSYSYDGLWQSSDVYNHNEIKTLSMDKKIRSCDFFRGSPKIMISPSSLDTLLENYQYFENLNILTPDFTLVRDNIWSSEDVEKYDRQLDILTNYLIDKTLSSGVVHSLGIFDLYIADTIAGTKYGKRAFSCFSGTNGCAITPIGVIYPCTRFYSNDKFPLYDCVNDVIYYDNINFFQRSSSSPIYFDKCKKCSLYKVCNAGCNYSQLECGNFEEFKPVDSVCEMFKKTYKYAYKYYRSVNTKVDYLKEIERRYFNG